MFKDLQLPEFPKNKLISVMDYQRGQFKVAMLESQVAQAKSAANYKATQIILNVDDMQYEDMVNLHQQVTNMLHRGVAKAHLGTKKLREALEKTEKQLKAERVLLQAKAKRVREMEQKFMSLASDPGQGEHAKKVLDDKDKEVMALKKKLKAPEANLDQTVDLITASEDQDHLLEQLCQFTLCAQRDQEKIQLLEGQV